MTTASISGESTGVELRSDEPADRRSFLERLQGWAWREWHPGWFVLAIVAAVVLVIVIFDDVRGVYESQRDVAISLSAAAIGFFFGKAREKTERQITSEKLVRLLQAGPLSDPKPMAYDREVERAFVETMVGELRKPISAQDPRVRDAVKENVSNFLRSLDFASDTELTAVEFGDAAVRSGHSSNHSDRPTGHLEGEGDETSEGGLSDESPADQARASSSSVISFADRRVHFTSNFDLVANGNGSGVHAQPDPVVLALDNSIRQYRDDHRILSHLTRVDRDIHACSMRLAEYWDQRAGSPTFPVEAPVLEVIMSDVRSAANAVIRLNGIFRNRDSMLGTEQLRMGLDELDPESTVEKVIAGEGVEQFQAAFRSASEAKNRYFDLLLLLDERQDTEKQSISVLRIAGSDTAKALRLFRSLNYLTSRSSDRAVTLQVLGYLKAANARMEKWNPPGDDAKPEQETPVGLISEVFKIDLGSAVENLERFLGMESSGSTPDGNGK